MPRPYPLTDIVKLVRAYGVLAGTSDQERVLAGSISRRWIASEVERQVPLASLPKALFRTPRGRDLLAAELFGDRDIDPETLQPDELDIASLAAGRMINSNRLPKLEPIIHEAVLVANILLGVKLYGMHGRGHPGISHDLIVAAMLQDAIGKPNRFSGITPVDHEIVDDAYVLTWFGDRIASLTRELSDTIRWFDAAFEKNLKPAEPRNPAIATAVAAIMASRLRLSARAAGDRVISFLDPAHCEELTAAGIDCSDDFPERQWLARDHARAVAAFAYTGCDHYALREPLRNTLLMAVKDVLEDPSKRDRLSGRRGKATHEVHMNLPVMEYFVAAEAPNSIETVHIASLEMMRSLERGRRKSLSSMSAHAFRIAELAERVLGRALEPLVVTVAMLHDVVEDGGERVTGFGHSLRRIQFRFGGPIAAMVSELTDSSVASAGALKARLTLKQPHLLSPQDQFDTDRFTKMRLKPTEAEVPYTLAGIVIKLLDTVVSLEEGIRDPELMSGHWRHSGARIYWAERVRGAIVRPLVERLVIELRHSRDDPRYADRPHHVNVVRLKAGRALIETMLTWQDLYATQNLAILAREYGLSENERALLIQLFNDRNVSKEWFGERVLHGLLDDGALIESLFSGRLPELGFTTLYRKDAPEGSARDESTFQAYRKAALRRQEIREEIGLATTAKLSSLQLRREQVLRAYDAAVVRSEDLEASVRVVDVGEPDPLVAPIAASSIGARTDIDTDSGTPGDSLVDQPDADIELSVSGNVVRLVTPGR